MKFRNPLARFTRRPKQQPPIVSNMENVVRFLLYQHSLQPALTDVPGVLDSPGFEIKSVRPNQVMIYHRDNTLALADTREHLKTYADILRSVGMQVKERTGLDTPHHLFVSVSPKLRF